MFEKRKIAKIATSISRRALAPGCLPSVPRPTDTNLTVLRKETGR